MKARGGRRDAPGKVLKDRRSPRERGRTGTSVVERTSCPRTPPTIAATRRRRGMPAARAELPSDVLLHDARREPPGLHAVVALRVRDAVQKLREVRRERPTPGSRLERGAEQKRTRRLVHPAAVRPRGRSPWSSTSPRARRGEARTTRPRSALAAARPSPPFLFLLLRFLRVVPYEANVGVELKGVRSGVERRRGRGLNARCGRRDTPGKVLKDRRSPRRRGRMWTSVRENAPDPGAASGACSNASPRSTKKCAVDARQCAWKNATPPGPTRLHDALISIASDSEAPEYSTRVDAGAEFHIHQRRARKRDAGIGATLDEAERVHLLERVAHRARDGDAEDEAKGGPREGGREGGRRVR